MQRLRAAQHRGQRLHGDAHDVIQGCWAVSETPAVWACVRSSQRCADSWPRSARAWCAPRCDERRGTGDFLEEVVVHIEEEAESRRKLIDIEPGFLAKLHIANAIGQVNASSCTAVAPASRMW